MFPGYQMLTGSGDYATFTEVAARSTQVPTTATLPYSWAVIVPRAVPAASCPIAVMCHGVGSMEAYWAGGDATGTITAGSWETQVSRTMRYLVDTHRFIIFFSQHGGNSTFGGGRVTGSGESMTRLGQQVAWLRTLPAAHPTNKMLFIGQSHGHVTAYNFAVRNPTVVGAVYGVVPLCDADQFYTSGSTQTRGEMNEAHRLDHPSVTINGVVYAARGTGVNAATWGVKSTYDPQTRAAAGDLVSLPYGVEYALDDTILDPATQATFVSTIGPTVTRIRNIGANHATWIQDDTDVTTVAAAAGIV
jgi:pimeloyl-ACP methyl ester carboxylesterase